MTEPADRLWAFACQTYAKPGVERTLLNLQDRSDHLVSLLLASLWLTTELRKISPAAGQRLRLKSARFHDLLIKPLRSARRNYWQAAMVFDQACRDSTEATQGRDQLKEVELTCERMEIAYLAPLLIEESVVAASGSLLGWSNMEALAPWHENDLDAVRSLLLVTHQS